MYEVPVLLHALLQQIIQLTLQTLFDIESKHLLTHHHSGSEENEVLGLMMNSQQSEPLLKLVGIEIHIW